MTNQKGITLVALVITIIVMLILVGVSVTIVLKTGLFDTTRKAANNTNEAINLETNYSEGLVNYNDGLYTLNQIANGDAHE